MRFFLLACSFVSFCWASEGAICTEIFEPSDVIKLAQSYQNRWHNYPREEKTLKQARQDIKNMTTITKGTSFTIDQCVTLHEVWQTLFHYQLSRPTWKNHHRTWTDWVANEPREALYIISPYIRDETPDSWKWLMQLAEEAPKEQEPEEADLSSLVKTYKSGFYKITESEIPDHILNDIGCVQDEIFSHIGITRTCTTDFVENLATIHLMYQESSSQKMHWFNWAQHNAQFVCSYLGLNIATTNPECYIILLSVLGENRKLIPSMRYPNVSSDNDTSSTTSSGGPSDETATPQNKPLGEININARTTKQ